MNPFPRPFYFRPDAVPQDDRALEADVCVYGGVAGGVAAAVQAARLGRSVVLLESLDHVGGMTAGGLGWTDFGNKGAVGGLAREFYADVGRAYGKTEPVWKFEPGVASRVLEEWLRRHDVRPLHRRYVDRVRVEDGRIREIALLGGLRVRAKMFVDASYEGDLMARAGVRYATGREANSVYGEQNNGVQVSKKHQFAYATDPYARPGDAGSGLLPFVDPAPLAPEGSGDHRIQAYNFRMCLCRRPDNRVPFPKPEGYDPAHYELLRRYLAGGWNEVFWKYDKVTPDKTDTNNHGAVSTDFIGQNYGYPDGTCARREAIFQAHVRWQQGLQWTLANDPAIPARVRDPMNEWGLAKDEFADTGHWPFQLYVREARRMVGDAVVNENHVWGRTPVEDPVGLASYGMDSHNCRRFVRDGAVWNEGDVQVHGFAPYPIPYRAIVPARGQCANLLVPVCVSASHIAYGSVRMEPVFMLLGQAAATAASIAIDERCPVQEVPYSALAARLRADGQVLEWKP